MTELRVTPGNLDSYGKLLDRVGDQAVAAHKYLSKYSDLGGGRGLFIKLVNPASHAAVRAASNVFSHLEKAGRSSNNSLKDAATYYRNTEHDTAVKVDASYPKVTRPTPNNIVTGQLLEVV